MKARTTGVDFMNADRSAAVGAPDGRSFTRAGPLGSTLPDTRRTLMPSQLDANHAARIDWLTLPYLYPNRYNILGGWDALMQLQPTKTNS